MTGEERGSLWIRRGRKMVVLGSGSGSARAAAAAALGLRRQLAQ